MKFTIAVDILSKKFGDVLSNERCKMKKYVKKHPEDKLIAEAFEAYIKVVGMPKKGEKEGSLFQKVVFIRHSNRQQIRI